MHNLTAQSVIRILIALVAFAVSPWIISELLAGNTTPFAALLGIGSLLIFVFYIGEKCWLSIPLCLPMIGSLNFLPVKFSPAELSIILVLSYVAFQFIMTDRRSFGLGPIYLWAPLLVIAALLQYHNIKSGGLGLNMSGGESAGGRKSFTIYCGMLALPALLWFRDPGDKWLRSIPLLYLIGSLLDFIPYVLSSKVPSLAPLIYQFYTGVNYEAYSSSLSGKESDIVRVGQLGQISLALQLVLFSYFRPQEWIRPSRFFVPVLSALALLGSTFSGFRSYLFNYIIISLSSLAFSIRWLTLLIIPSGVGIIAILVAGQGSAFNLPLQIQRTLSPLPGNWSPIAVAATEGSDSFRESIQKTYRAEFMDQSGFFGSGYAYSSKVMKDTALDFYTQNLMADPNSESRSYITRRDHHVGWVAVHHVIGTIGLIAFAMLCLGSLYYVFTHILRIKPKNITPTQIWSCSLIVQGVFAFFTVFGAMQNFLPPLCVYLAIAIISFRPRPSAASSLHQQPSRVMEPALASGQP